MPPRRRLWPDPRPPATGAPPPRLRRAKYIRGVVEATEARSLKGPELVERTLAATAAILEGMELAASYPRHTFLVYNGSVHFWHASWVLQREGMRKHVVDHLSRVVEYLRAVQGQDRWRSRLNIALARGQAETGEARALGSPAAPSPAAPGRRPPRRRRPGGPHRASPRPPPSPSPPRRPPVLPPRFSLSYPPPPPPPPPPGSWRPPPNPG